MLDVRFTAPSLPTEGALALMVPEGAAPAGLWKAADEASGGAASRAFAIANALEGLSRAEAARLAGMERQALRDAAVRYNSATASATSSPPSNPRAAAISVWCCPPSLPRR